MKRLTRAALVAASTTAMVGGLALPHAPALAAGGVTTVATGFAGPLHLTVAPDGGLLVADAFIGEIKRINPRTGAVTEITRAHGFTPGIDAQGQQVYFTQSVEPHEGVSEPTSVLTRVTPGGSTKVVADLLDWELTHNPDRQPLGVDDADSNPYAVLALPGRVLVADAAGNDIVEVRANGAMRTLTVFPVSFEGECATRPNNGVPNGGCDPTPTDLALGPDGFLYVSGLGGEAEGHIWKVNATTGQIVDHHDGFPPLTGIAVAKDGTIYAASLFAGLVFRLSPAGAMTVAEVPGVADVALARDGTLYATTVDFSGGPGSVVRVAQSAFHAPAP